MKKRLLAIVSAFAVAFAINTAVSAQPAQALGWSSLINHSSNNYGIMISTTDPYVYSSTLYPGYRNDRVSCFRVLENMHSAYGGNYYVGTTRCFASSGNTLALYSGLA